ncbi:UbiA family prenyltransferase [Planosporangium flavigriseum]|uniref:Membrane protein n=1 Tax=Planosporangium flavigriseum TaxID=373681 RepID=A0A8J3LYL8_9ACTN|nr:UbiA family prenyltransferase [Planosporangium flavigriseum]NJC63867.1 UbiA family prenyltransferase [Planosporangium flavigriseum]GIG75906.1 membrane protein [Planosporangium flavigriseum]
MRSALGLLKACHPEPTAAVTTVAALLAVATGRDAGGTLAVGAAVLASQLAVGWCNDAVDATRDSAVGRLDKPIVTGLVARRTVAAAAATAAALTVPLALLSGLPAGSVATLGLASALLYNWPLKSTIASVLPYAVSFAALPAFVVLGVSRPPWWLVAAGGLLGAGAHFANVLPDLDDDARTGVRGLPHRLGARRSVAVGGGLLFAATATLALGPPGPPSWTALLAFAGAAAALAVGGYVAGRRPTSRAAFRSVLLVAVLDVALLLSAGHRM